MERVNGLISCCRKTHKHCEKAAQFIFIFHSNHLFCCNLLQMRTISGTIVSTKPVNLSKAAKILSSFVNTENGASQSVSVYLQRASAAFDELVYFKKHHEFKKNRSKDEASTKSDISCRSLEDEGRAIENGGEKKKLDQEPVGIDENATKKDEGKLKKKEKKEKKKKQTDVKNENIEIEKGDFTVNEKSEEKKKKKMKTDLSLGSEKNGNIKIEEGDVTVKEKSEEKKKKKKRKNAEVDGGENGNSATPERKKKRKTEE